jgi:hypothetical protein
MFSVESVVFIELTTYSFNLIQVTVESGWQAFKARNLLPLRVSGKSCSVSPALLWPSFIQQQRIIRLDFNDVCRSSSHWLSTANQAQRTLVTSGRVSFKFGPVFCIFFRVWSLLLYLNTLVVKGTLMVYFSLTLRKTRQVTEETLEPPGSFKRGAAELEDIRILIKIITRYSVYWGQGC